MMGYGEDKGIIPIACRRIFDRVHGNTDDSLTLTVTCSMMEIYMEKVRGYQLFVLPKSRGVFVVAWRRLGQVLLRTQCRFVIFSTPRTAMT